MSKLLIFFLAIGLTLICAAEDEKNLAKHAEQASLPGLLSKWALKFRKLPVGVETIQMLDDLRPSLDQLHNKIAKIPRDHLDRMHDYFHEWAKEITDPKLEDPEVVEKKWIDFQMRHRNSMIVAQDEIVMPFLITSQRSNKKRAYELWTRVKEMVRHHTIPANWWQLMDDDFNLIFGGYGKQLVLATRRWETLINKVTAHGGINEGAHRPVMRCGACGEEVDLHEWILKFDYVIEPVLLTHSTSIMSPTLSTTGSTSKVHQLLPCPDETDSDSFAEWANHLRVQSKCGAEEAWIHMGPKEDL